mmetsp:Transcript_5182/g.11443  ORF Transcript_5182/g.11443 Transcript_5182/m.11443 type:complete len:117 (-) Transcript_5182:1779-2129(-)
MGCWMVNVTNEMMQSKYGHRKIRIVEEHRDGYAAWVVRGRVVRGRKLAEGTAGVHRCGSGNIGGDGGEMVLDMPGNIRTPRLQGRTVRGRELPSEAARQDTCRGWTLSKAVSERLV